MIASYSSALYYNPELPDLSIPQVHSHHDEVDLMQAIAVKAQSSAQQKQLWKDIQTHQPNPSPVVSQLPLDMPIWWPSTYVMLDCAEKKRAYVDTFVYELSLHETNLTKYAKINQLKLHEDEWACITLFTSLLAHADKAQQSFSSDKGASLHLALPALEALHKAWSTCSENPKYKPFQEALQQGVSKIHKYYN
ncbi:hypothetical protein BDR04DRAFT_1158793 [Suillus decipiens]|nr:hypothetical protein BDR04DRAFT_1158793 [Suillus decipiens]